MKATDLVPLSVPEVRRLVCAAATAPEQQRHCYLLAWSHFRRTHQAGAGHAHALRRARTRPRSVGESRRDPAAPGPAPRLAGTATLTEATWAQIAPLLPPLQLARKRTRYAHRGVLDGILAVMRSGRSWREAPAPASAIPWPILYQRYSLWRTLRSLGRHPGHPAPGGDALFVT